MIEVNVLKNGITLNETERLTSGSVNVYPIHFHFSHHWDGLEKVAVFRTSLISINMPVSEDDIAMMPWEVTTTVGLDVRMGVCGIKAGEIVLPTVWTTLGKVVEGAKVADAESGDHTPDIYDLILVKIQEFIDGLQAFEDELDTVRDEIPTNDEIISIVWQYIINHPDSLYSVVKNYLTTNQTAIENDIRKLITSYLKDNKGYIEQGINDVVTKYINDDPSFIEKIVEMYLIENSSTISNIVGQYLDNNPDAIEGAVDDYLTEHPPGVNEENVKQIIENYLKENPIDTLSSNDVNNLIQNYLTENNSEIDQIIENYLSNNQVGVTEERVQEMINASVGSAIRSGY